jgi:hypothetical protein
MKCGVRKRSYVLLVIAARSVIRKPLQSLISCKTVLAAAAESFYSFIMGIGGGLKRLVKASKHEQHTTRRVDN